MKENLLNFDLDDYQLKKHVTDFVDFPSFYGLEKVKIPIYVYRASEQISPCVVITSCIHGDEINGMRISQDLISKKIKIIRGTLIVLPVINIYGFLNKQRYLPDRKDLNRCFPGFTKGSFGSRFADFIFQNITKYGDVFIDLHSGPPGRYNVPQIRCDLSNKTVRSIVDHTSIPLIVNSSIRDGSLREAINDLDKPCIVFEGGEGLRIDENITRYGLNLIKSVFVYLRMLSKPQSLNKNKIIIKKSRWIRAKEGGIFINRAKPGNIVRKGDVLGELRQITGELITKIKIDYDGVILGESKSSLIMSGDALYNIGILDLSIHDEDEEIFDYFDM